VQRKLLLVDDEIGILRALRRFFRRAGYQIFTAESAEEALSVLAQNEIHVILSDFRMPGADGGVLLEQASQLDPACVGMILSGFAELKQVISAFNSGVVHRFISKPWQDHELLEQVENAFAVALQKHIDLDLDQSQLLATAQSGHKRCFPVELVDHLDHTDGHSLIALEFVSPRVLMPGSGLNVKQALAKRVTELIEQLPSNVEFCHWSGYTLVLLTPKVQLQEVLEQVQVYKQQIAVGWETPVLRWSHLEMPEGKGVDQIRSLLLALAHTQSEEAAFLDSNWTGLLNSSLSAALADTLNHRDFSLVFQPINSDQDRLVALEALIRCDLTDRSNLSLTSLIRQIDLLGYTEQFTEIQIGLALKEFVALKLPSEVKLVLNFSLRQLSWPGLRTLLQNQLALYSFDLSRLSLDVGESALSSAIPACLQNLEWFRSQSVEMTLDDQGAAHAYLNSEKSLSVDAVKLDRAFLHDLDTQTNRQEMLVNLCDRILERGKRLSFEGVENNEQLKFVRTRYSFTYQGYGLSEPLSGDEILAWYANRGDQ